jgi:hypothetical protein
VRPLLGTSSTGENISLDVRLVLFMGPLNPPLLKKTGSEEDGVHQPDAGDGLSNVQLDAR